MIPLFGEDDIHKHGEINLGGARSASYSDILQEAKAQRDQDPGMVAWRVSRARRLSLSISSVSSPASHNV